MAVLGLLDTGLVGNTGVVLPPLGCAGAVVPVGNATSSWKRCAGRMPKCERSSLET